MDMGGGLDMGGDMDMGGGMDMSDEYLLGTAANVLLDEPVYAPVPLHVLLDLEGPIDHYQDVGAMHDRVLEEQEDAGLVPAPVPAPVPATILLPPLPPRRDTVTYDNATNSARQYYDPLLRLTEGMDKGLIRILDTLWSPSCDLGVKGCENVVDLLRSQDLPERHDIPNYTTMRKDVEYLCQRPPSAYFDATCNLDDMGWTSNGGERTFRCVYIVFIYALAMHFHT
jgi:hypothetical protein